MIEARGNRKSNGGLVSLLGLFTSTGTLLCCALPAAVAMVAGGSAVIAMTSAFPWLIPLSRNKGWIFLVAVALLVLQGIMLFRRKRAVACPVDGDESCSVAGRFTKVTFYFSVGIVAIGAFFAYALVPLLRILEV